MSGQFKTCCTSTAKINFPNIRDLTKLVSERIVVPEIDGVWWIEAYQMFAASFNNIQKAPQIKIAMQMNNEDLVDSKLLCATINMREVTMSAQNNIIFSNHQLAINSKHIEIDTASRVYKNSSSRQKSSNVYQQRSHNSGFYIDSNGIILPWSRKQLFNFDCSIKFRQHLGKYENELQSAKTELVHPQERVLNLETFSSLYENDKFTDFTFIVKGKEFKVHKCLLASVSSVFKLMFTSGLDETKNNSVEINCNPEVFKIFLEFIYKNTLPPPDKDFPTSQFFDLYQLAHCYNIAPLMKICLAVIMKKKVDSSNALDLYEFASAYDVKELTDKTWTFIKVEMLNIYEPCEAKPLEQIKVMLHKMRQFEQDRRSFVS